MIALQSRARFRDYRGTADASWWRDVLSAVLRTAVDYGRLASNPAERVRLRRKRLKAEKPFLRIERFDLLLEVICEPYATMVYVAVFTALRVSELAGLR